MVKSLTPPALAERSPAATTVPPHRGEARLYLAAAVLYIALGVATRSLVLNWIVGPLFPFLVVYLVPRQVRRWRASRTGRGDRGGPR